MDCPDSSSLIEQKIFIIHHTPPTRGTDLPDMCLGADPWAAKPQSKAWKNQLEYNIMSCTECKNHYCPGKETPQTCKDYCSPDAWTIGIEKCKGACDGAVKANSEQCLTCRAECEAACTCSDESNCTPYTEDAALCMEQGHKWVAQLSQSFDNIGFGMLTLFEISTTEGWVDVMYAAVDARGEDLQPKRDFSEVGSSRGDFYDEELLIPGVSHQEGPRVEN